MSGVEEQNWNTYRFASNMIYFPMVVLQFINHCFADQRPRWSAYDSAKEFTLPHVKECPRMTASFLSRILFSWFEPMVLQGYRRPLTEDDVSELAPQETTKYLTPGFDKYWRESIEKGHQKQQRDEVKTGEKSVNSRRTNGSVFPAMVKAFGGPFWFAGILKLVIDLLEFAPPFLLG